MTEVEYIRNKKYEEIIETQCKAGCKSYRPGSKYQCNILKFLLLRQDKDLITKEHCMLDGMRCKGFVSKVSE